MTTTTTTRYPRMDDGSRLLHVSGVYAYRAGSRWVVLTTDDGGYRFETVDPDGGAYTGGESAVLEWAKRWGRRYPTLTSAAASVHCD